MLLWDLTDRTTPRRLGAPLTGHVGSVWSVAFSPDGRALATGGIDATSRLWDLSEFQRIRSDLTGEACRRAGGLTEAEWRRYISDLPFHQVCP